MSRVVVVGAAGHIGTCLVPRLVRGGHEVIAMSRGIRGAYLPGPEWGSVTTVTVTRPTRTGPSAPRWLRCAPMW